MDLLCAPTATCIVDHTAPNATIAVYPDAGCVPYRSRRRTIDFGRLNDAALARSTRAPADVAAYFFVNDPDVLVASRPRPGELWDDLGRRGPGHRRRSALPDGLRTGLSARHGRRGRLRRVPAEAAITGRALPIAGALVAALAVAALLDALGISWLNRETWVPIGSAAVVGALQAVAWSRRPALLRRAVVGAVVAGAAELVLVRAPLGWLELGALGAGPPGALPLVALPLVSVLAVIAVLGAPVPAQRGPTS